MNNPEVYIHPTADVSPDAQIGKGTKIWNWVQIRENAEIGELCVLSKGVYVDKDVLIGNKVKIQNNVSVFNGVTIEDGVFVGPHVCFTNDLHPRAVTSDFELASEDDWEIARTLVKEGASIGANSTIIAGHVLGSFAMIGAGSVVTKDIPDFAIAYGNPAKVIGEVDITGNRK